MAAIAVDSVERRREPRLVGGGSRWNVAAMIRPGQPVTLINICSRAALVESPSRLRPGAHTEIQLTTIGMRASIKGRLDRCFVAGLEPLCYRGVLIFDHGIEVDDGASAQS